MIENFLENGIIEERITIDRKIRLSNDNLMNSIKNYFENRGIIIMKDMATVDRIEGEYAVCEMLDGEMKDISLNLFKEKVSEGDIFNVEVLNNNGKEKIIIGDKNIAEMEERRKIILEMLNKLKNK